MKLMGFTEVVGDLYLISTKKHLSSSKKRSLIWAYLNIRFRRLFFEKKLNLKKELKQSFLNYKVNIRKFSDFYWTFREIFIDEDYYFNTENDEPFIVDLGGNIGISVLYFKWIYPKSKILVFEALPENVIVLKENINNNHMKNVEIIEKAVGGKNDVLTIYGDRRAATISNSFIKKQNESNNSKDNKKTQIKLVTLSSYIKDKKVDLIKMDIEGAERDVVYELAEKGVLKNVKFISMEYHRFSVKENSFVDIVSILEQNNFGVVYWSDFRNLGKFPKREYYNFMLYAKKY